MRALRPRRVSVIGAGSCDEATFEAARVLGGLLARGGFDIVCGGLGGVMTAACQGAREAGGHTIGILPGDDPAAANPFVDIPVVTGLGIARNVLVVQNGDVVVAVAGGAGKAAAIVAVARASRTGILVIDEAAAKAIQTIIHIKNRRN